MAAQCLNCWRAGEGKDSDGNPWPTHCGNCSCCNMDVCAAHGTNGCDKCN
jgi:hypothetical protein